jgi:hypothetical protein
MVVLSEQKAKYYSLDHQATVPTPPDQEDVNALDMVSGAVEEMVDTFQKDVGLGEPPENSDGRQGMGSDGRSQ